MTIPPIRKFLDKKREFFLEKRVFSAHPHNFAQNTGFARVKREMRLSHSGEVF